MIRVVAAVIENEHGEVLLTRRVRGTDIGCWEFPGGKLKSDESAQAALERELLEETGVIAQAGSFIDCVEDRVNGYLIEFHECRIVSGSPAALDNGGIAWIPKGQLSSLELAHNDRIFVQRRFGGSGRMIFITGGARSGKSAFAERIALGEPRSVKYIATARAFDDEMRDRIARHKARRPANWTTFEGSYDIGAQIAGFEGTVLLDCMTILLTNRMMDAAEDWDTAPTSLADEIEQRLHAELDEWRALIPGSADTSLIIVSNELGSGIVPVYRFGRIFRDIAGRLNQRCAQIADEAYLSVAGRQIRL